MACNAPHRRAMRSWPKALGNRLCGSLSALLGIGMSYQRSLILTGARHSIPILLWLVLGAAAAARAQVSPAPVPLDPIPPGLVAAETERVVEIVDGDTLILAGGRQVRLVGIQVATRFAAFHLSSFSSPQCPTNPVIPPQNIFTLFHRAPRRIFCLVTPMSPRDSWA